MHPPSLVFLDIHNLNVGLDCLALIGNTLKHLVLSGLRSTALPTENDYTGTSCGAGVGLLVFGRNTEIITASSPMTTKPWYEGVQNNLVLPRLQHVSLSQEDGLEASP